MLTSEDRVVLLQALADALPQPAHTSILAAATSGVRWRPTSDAASTRMGGMGLLPQDVPWPTTDAGVRLSFVAALDFAELPRWAPLPRVGMLSLFAQLRGDGVEHLVEPASNIEGSAIRIFAIGDGEGRSVQAPAGVTVIPHRALEAVTGPTVPDDYESAERFGLRGTAAWQYSEIAAVLRYGPGGYSSDVGAHWTLGQWSDNNHAPVDPTEVLLLHLDDDDELGVDLGGGAIQFRISEEELRRGNWSQAWAEPAL